MNQPKEANWTEILRPAPFTIRPTKTHKCNCGNANCKHAKKIRCECGCGGSGHGQENRVGMEPLDKTLGLEIEAPAPLGDLGLSRELSGLAEVEGEI